jgi:hypothetical protein
MIREIALWRAPPKPSGTHRRWVRIKALCWTPPLPPRAGLLNRTVADRAYHHALWRLWAKGFSLIPRGTRRKDTFFIPWRTGVIFTQPASRHRLHELVALLAKTADSSRALLPASLNRPVTVKIHASSAALVTPAPGNQVAHGGNNDVDPHLSLLRHQHRRFGGGTTGWLPKSLRMQRP